jgi:hypothetical protein
MDGPLEDPSQCRSPVQDSEHRYDDMHRESVHAWCWSSLSRFSFLVSLRTE